MKKQAITILAFMGFASAALAQTVNDAFTFSENTYEGTARTIAMGNAFTALGGDLGSIGINPAGSAVAKYSQVTISPGLTVSSSSAIGNPVKGSELGYFQNKTNIRHSSFNLPNLGATFNLNTGRRSGLKNITFGFAVNKTADYNQDILARGSNSSTTFLGAMAAGAAGIPSINFDGSDAWDRGNPWQYVIGFKTGMIGNIPGSDSEYVGATEYCDENGSGGYDIGLAGLLNQSYGRKVSGDKYEYAINIGFNISDIVYLGVNLNAHSLSYSYTDYFKEAAANPADFAFENSAGQTVEFNQMKYQNDLDVTGSGFSGKVGVIVTPGFGLRLGAAIQTPAVMNFRERWSEYGENTLYINGRNELSSQATPDGSSSYRLISPFRANFGLAWTFGRFGVISADYEFCNYGEIKYTASNADSDFLADLNDAIKNTYDTSHSARLGLEVKPVNSFAIRAGYMYSSPAHKDDIELGKKSEKSLLQLSRHALSFGLGYAGKGSFFCDLAALRTFEPTEYYMPYSDYILNNDNTVVDGLYAPELKINKNQWKVVLTLGWRF